VRGLAHDIANPLNAVSMNAELAKAFLARGDTERTKEVLARLGEDCARFSRLLQGFQRFGANLRQGDREDVPARDLATEAVQRMQRELPDAHLDCEVQSADAPLHVDRRGMEYALAEVLRNAAEARARRARVAVRSEAGFAYIEVIDDGPGLKMDTCARARRVLHHAPCPGSGRSWPHPGARGRAPAWWHIETAFQRQQRHYGRDRPA
jgi:signal transduction histidine kinase